jgi:7-keto-8-aminopelargonate synthetase-like enzyme
LIYSAGWLAGFGVIKSLVKKTDHIVMDRLAHNCLQEGSMASTSNIHKFDHLDQ